jgi:hypothetical protein
MTTRLDAEGSSGPANVLLDTPPQTRGLISRKA